VVAVEVPVGELTGEVVKVLVINGVGVLVKLSAVGDTERFLVQPAEIATTNKIEMGAS
jgi:hypothetical protein